MLIYYHLIYLRNRRLQSSSLHHQAIRALHTQHGDSFSTCVRLFSLWLSKHYFSGYFSHRQIELLSAAAYLDPSTLCPPTTSSSALFRVLSMLGKHSFDHIYVYMNIQTYIMYINIYIYIYIYI
jgi:hypothetical protein